MAEPNWAKVLTALYQGELGVGLQQRKFKMYEVLDYLEDETGLTRSEIQSSLRFLSNMELVQGFSLGTDEEDTEVMAAILPEGFQVAHERELKQKQILTNRSLVFFTFSLVLVSIINEFPPLFKQFGWMVIFVGVLYWIVRAIDN